LYVDAETIIDASPPIVAANMSRTPNMMKTCMKFTYQKTQITVNVLDHMLITKL
jgi:hypothetical protein